MFILIYSLYTIFHGLYSLTFIYKGTKIIKISTPGPAYGVRTYVQSSH